MNALQISKACKIKYNTNINYIVILNFLAVLRKVIAYHMKYKYRSIKIDRTPDKNLTLAINECL